MSVPGHVHKKKMCCKVDKKEGGGGILVPRPIPITFYYLFLKKNLPVIDTIMKLTRTRLKKKPKRKKKRYKFLLKEKHIS